MTRADAGIEMTGFDCNDSDMLAIELTDEALESAARGRFAQGLAFTVAMCTGLGECPF